MRPGQGPSADHLLTDPFLRDVPVHEGFKVLEPAVLYDRVGQGGMGTVYRGRHVKLDLDVAVKCLKPSLAAEDPGYIRRFEREARLAASIAHQNVVRVMDVNHRFGLHYLVMEFVAGETARERVLRKGRLNEREALAIMLGAATGLAVAHGRSIVHRDIKPDNILIAGDGCVKVADLGLAKAARGVDAMSQTVNPSGIMGTPQFMAPEQWDSSDVTPAADIWALGATLYYLLAGSSAIPPGPLLSVARRIQDDEFPPLRDVRRGVHRRVHALLERCVRRRPEDRFADARALVRALRPLVTEDDPSLIDPDTGTGSFRGSIVTPPPRDALLRIKAVIANEPLWNASSYRAPDPPPREPTDPETPRRDAQGHAAEAEPAPSLHEAQGRLTPRPVSGTIDQTRLPIQTGIRLGMIPVDAQEFVMGSPETESGRYSDEQPHVVRVTTPYWLAETQVTQEQWYELMGTRPWRGKPHVREAPAVAATYMSWRDVDEFCRRLTHQERVAGRLPNGHSFLPPTEAEWELACRTGTRTAYCFGEDVELLKSHAVFAGSRSGEHAHDVRTRRPNQWGFFDMHGNVWEWCADEVDWHMTARVVASTYRDGVEDPYNRGGQRRVIRGGGWGFGYRDLRSAARSVLAPHMASGHVGFRPALVARRLSARR